jgi:hypothetical protein
MKTSSTKMSEIKICVVNKKYTKDVFSELFKSRNAMSFSTTYDVEKVKNHYFLLVAQNNTTILCDDWDQLFECYSKVGNKRSFSIYHIGFNYDKTVQIVYNKNTSNKMNSSQFNMLFNAMKVKFISE